MQAFLLPALILAATLAGNVRAACPADIDIALLAAHYANLQPAANPPPNLTMADAGCAREKFTAFLGQNLGPMVGYKAALTNPVVQKRFNHASPVRGTLFAQMLLPQGKELPARVGTRPFFEADLIVKVADADINAATTPGAVLRHLSEIYPFIELPDLIVADPGQLTGPGVVYINAGARAGILGQPIPVRAGPELLAALGTMTVTVRDAEGKELDRAQGSAILEHPLNAVLWLIADLRRDGLRLNKGDLISLGSFSRPLPIKAGAGATVAYDGLPGNPTVSVRFP